MLFRSDIGKNSFHVVGHDARGAIVLRQKWSRGQVEARLANLPPCLIGDARAANSLLPLLTYPDSIVRMAVMKALGQIRSRQAVAPLLEPLRR